MTPVNPSELTDQALMDEAKKQKQLVILFRVFMCLLIPASIYNATHKGSFIASCLPLVFMSFFIKSENNYKAIKAEMQARNLNN